MLLAFRVRNFRSIRDEQELSMMRSRRIAAHSEDGRGADSEIASTVAGIYGSNASGKSNLIHALTFARNAVVDSYSSWKPDSGTPHDPFLLDDTHSDQPSRFEVDLALDSVRYQYGFELDGKIINSEWLYAYPNGRRQTWFERRTKPETRWHFGKGLGGRNRVITELTRDNTLFLSAAATAKHEKIARIYQWFNNHLKLANQTNSADRMRFTIDQIENNEDYRSAVQRLLTLADLGICGLEVRRADISPLERQRMRMFFQALNDTDSESRRTDEEIDDLIHQAYSTVEMKHARNNDLSPIGLPMHAESIGTQSLLALGGPLVHALLNGDTLMIDEIGSSLHPHLVIEIVNLFTSTRNTKQAQLIFTTHETSLMGTLIEDKPALERDQIWLVEKDSAGASTVYPMTDYHPRKVENLQRGYLRGRFGGVPFARLDELVTPSPPRGDNE